jgi:hypothetical protein
MKGRLVKGHLVKGRLVKRRSVRVGGDLAKEGLVEGHSVLCTLYCLLFMYPTYL